MVKRPCNKKELSQKWELIFTHFPESCAAHRGPQGNNVVKCLLCFYACCHGSGFHTPDNPERGRNRESIVTSLETQVMVCVKRHQRHIGVFQMPDKQKTKNAWNFIALDFINCNPSCCAPDLLTPFCLPFQTISL